MSQTTIETLQSEIRIVKTASCPSLSGKGTLKYFVGCTSDAQILLSIHANSGSGMFSQEWLPLAALLQELAKVPKEQPVSSSSLHALFQGKSINTPAFLFAVMKHEGFVEPSKTTKRQYDRLDPKPALTALEALVNSKVDLRANSAPPPNTVVIAKHSDGSPESSKGATTTRAQSQAIETAAKNKGGKKSVSQKPKTGKKSKR